MSKRNAKKTILYDCSVDLKIEIPRTKKIDVNMIYRTTLIAIAHEFVSKHEEYEDLIQTIYLILEKTVSATKKDFKASENKQNVLNMKCKDAGQIRRCGPPADAPIIYDKITYSAEVDKNYQSYGPVRLECNVQMFLSPGIYGGTDLYKEHGFFMGIDDYKDKDEDDVPEIIKNWCAELEEEEIEKFDLGDRWGWVAVGLEEYPEYWDSKHSQYDSN